MQRRRSSGTTLRRNRTIELERSVVPDIADAEKTEQADPLLPGTHAPLRPAPLRSGFVRLACAGAPWHVRAHITSG